MADWARPTGSARPSKRREPRCRARAAGRRPSARTIPRRRRGSIRAARAAGGRRRCEPGGRWATVPTMPLGEIMLRLRTAAHTTSPRKTAAVAVVVAITTGATLTTGSNGSPGSVNRADAPSAKQTRPPTPRRPWLVTVTSSPNRTMASRISSRPPTLSGSAPRPMNARISARRAEDAGHEVRAPQLGDDAGGPALNSRKAMVGSDSSRMNCWNGFIPTSIGLASVRSSVIVSPATSTWRPLAKASTSSRVAAVPSTTPSLTASLTGDDLASRTAETAQSTLRCRASAIEVILAIASFRILSPSRAGDVLALPAHRGRGADARARAPSGRCSRQA